MVELELMDDSFSVMPWMKGVEGYWPDASFWKFQKLASHSLGRNRGEQPILQFTLLSLDACPPFGPQNGIRQN